MKLTCKCGQQYEIDNPQEVGGNLCPDCFNQILRTWRAAREERQRKADMDYDRQACEEKEGSCLVG